MEHRPRGHRPPLRLGAAAGLVLLGLVATASLPSGRGPAGAAWPAATAAPPTTAPPASHAPPAATAGATATGTTVVDIPIRSWRRLPASPPVRVEIPAIRVASRLIRLGLDRDGSLEVPRDFQVAGWFVGGPQPGQLGPAVLAGHVDSRSGPAVFYRLRELRQGDLVTVIRADGLPVRFQVESVASYPKQALPSRLVYGPATTPSLRLITCTGTFDRSRRSYRDNLVVSARVLPEGGR